MWWCRTAPADQPSAFIVNGDTGNQVFLPVGLQYMRGGGGGGGGWDTHSISHHFLDFPKGTVDDQFDVADT